MKLQRGNTYLINLAPGWFVAGRVEEAIESADGTGGHYILSHYTYCDFADAPFTDALKDVNGKPAGLKAARGANLHQADDVVRAGISDAMIIQWFLLPDA